MKPVNAEKDFREDFVREALRRYLVHYEKDSDNKLEWIDIKRYYQGDNVPEIDNFEMIFDLKDNIDKYLCLAVLKLISLEQTEEIAEMFCKDSNIPPDCIDDKFITGNAKRIFSALYFNEHFFDTAWMACGCIRQEISRIDEEEMDFSRKKIIEFPNQTDRVFLEENNYIPRSYQRYGRSLPRRVKFLIRSHTLATGISAAVIAAIVFFAGLGLGIFQKPSGAGTVIAGGSSDTQGFIKPWVYRFVPPKQAPRGSYESLRLGMLDADVAGTPMDMGKGVSSPVWPINFDRALSYYTDTIEQNQSDPEIIVNAYIGRGITYAMKVQLDSAVNDFSEALKLDPKNTDALYNRGLVYAGMGSKENLEHAVADFKIVLSLNPEDKDAIRCLVDISTGAGALILDEELQEFLKDNTIDSGK